MKTLSTTLLLTGIAGILPLTVSAQQQNNQNVTAIFGSGNPNNGWQTDTANNVELALRAKNRTTGVVTDNSGVYNFATGFRPGSATQSFANFEFSINDDVDGTTGANLATGLHYELLVDTDPSQGTSFTTVNPLTEYPDNSYGVNSTANGHGTTGSLLTDAALQGLDNIAQNSENTSFGPFGLNSTINSSYEIELEALNTDNRVVAETSIEINFGTGGAPVPDAASTGGLLGLGLLALGSARRFLGRK